MTDPQARRLRLAALDAVEIAMMDPDPVARIEETATDAAIIFDVEADEVLALARSHVRAHEEGDHRCLGCGASMPAAFLLCTGCGRHIIIGRSSS